MLDERIFIKQMNWVCWRESFWARKFQLIVHDQLERLRAGEFANNWNVMKNVQIVESKQSLKSVNAWSDIEEFLMASARNKR